MKLDIKSAVLSFFLSLVGIGIIFTFKDWIEFADVLWNISLGLPPPWGSLVKALSMYVLGYAIAYVYYHRPS